MENDTQNTQNKQTLLSLLNWSLIINGAMSSLIVIIILGAVAIIWKGKSDLSIQAEYMGKAVPLLEKEIFTLKKQNKDISEVINELPQIIQKAIHFECNHFTNHSSEASVATTVEEYMMIIPEDPEDPEVMGLFAAEDPEDTENTKEAKEELEKLRKELERMENMVISPPPPPEAEEPEAQMVLPNEPLNNNMHINKVRESRESYEMPQQDYIQQQLPNLKK